MLDSVDQGLQETFTAHLPLFLFSVTLWRNHFWKALKKSSRQSEHILQTKICNYGWIQILLPSVTSSEVACWTWTWFSSLSGAGARGPRQEHRSSCSGEKGWLTRWPGQLVLPLSLPWEQMGFICSAYRNSTFKNWDIIHITKESPFWSAQLSGF